MESQIDEEECESKQYVSKIPEEIRLYYEPFRRPATNEVVFRKIYNTDFCFDSHYVVIDVFIKPLISQTVGQGGYGMVAAVRDRRNDEFYAMKKIENPSSHILIAKRTLRELRILRYLDHENVIGNNSLLLPDSREKFKDM